MRLFFDSSALAKRYVEEAGSPRIGELLAGAGHLGVSILALPEVVSALCRRRRESRLDRAHYEAA